MLTDIQGFVNSRFDHNPSCDGQFFFFFSFFYKFLFHPYLQNFPEYSVTSKSS